MKIKGLKLVKGHLEIEELEWGTIEDMDMFERLLKLFERMQENP